MLEIAAATLLVAHVSPFSPADDGRCVRLICKDNLTPSQMFALAARFQSEGRWSEAEAVLDALTQDSNGHVRNEARFRIGLSRERRGDLAGAEWAYRAILEESPFAASVRLELARVLAAMGDEEGARRQLRLASSGGLPEDVVRAVNQFQSALRSRKRMGASFEIGLAPDSNINRAQGRTSVDIGSLPLELSDDATAQSGVGLTVRGQGYWRPKVAKNVNLLVTINTDADLYRKYEFDDIGLFGTAGPELLTNRTRWRLSVAAGERWFGLDPYSTSVGATLNVLHSLNPTSQIQLDAAVIRSAYHVNHALDGTNGSVSIRYERAFSPRWSGRATLRADRKNAHDSAFATWTIGGEILLARETGPTTLYGRAGYYRNRADEAFSFPPVRRNDTLIDLEGGLVMNRFAIWGSAPVIRLHWTRNDSPVFFYDFKRTRLEFAFAREF